MSQTGVCQVIMVRPTSVVERAFKTSSCDYEQQVVPGSDIYLPRWNRYITATEGRSVNMTASADKPHLGVEMVLSSSLLGYPLLDAPSWVFSAVLSTSCPGFVAVTAPTLSF